MVIGEFAVDQLMCQRTVSQTAIRYIVNDVTVGMLS